MASHPDKEEKFNPRRRLCPDGACIGIIGSNGKCTVCGAADAPHERPESKAPSLEEDDAPLPDAEHETVADDHDEGDHDEGGTAFDPKRRLCSDDACIGVIGSDNRCSECGKPADA